MHKRNIKITIMYDGSNYSGWQRLGASAIKESIQGVLEQELSEVMLEPILIIGSGRTDQGVHAYAGVANFHTDSEKALEEIMREMNQLLPEDIRITNVMEVAEHFHSRHSAKSKTYIYRIDNEEFPCVFSRKYTYHHKKQLDIDNMKKAADYLVGKHDFLGFSSPMKDSRTTIREIYSINIDRNSNLIPFCKGKNDITIKIKGNGFLYNMVRIIVGTLIEIGEGSRAPEDMKIILNSKDRSLAGPMAQYQGLALLEVKY